MLTTTQDRWNKLLEASQKRKEDLDDSLLAQQYFAEANEAEAWMGEKEPLVGNTDCGKDEDSAEAHLKKHEALMSDIIAYKSIIDGLRDQANACKVKMSVFQYSSQPYQNMIKV